MADARATAVAKLRIEQLFAISLTGKAVAPCPPMAMPLFLFLCEGVAHAHARAMKSMVRLDSTQSVIVKPTATSHLPRRVSQSDDFQKMPASFAMHSFHFTKVMIFLLCFDRSIEVRFDFLWLGRVHLDYSAKYGSWGRSSRRLWP